MYPFVRVPPLSRRDLVTQSRLGLIEPREGSNPEVGYRSGISSLGTQSRPP